MDHSLIDIVEYDPTWPDRYASERDRVLDAIGRHVERIEHIGSTSVPGLASKPIVDIAVEVDDWTQVEECIDPVEALGYDFIESSRDADRRWRYFEKRPDDGQAYNCHLFAAADDWVEMDVLFRDYLREHSDVANEYERVKREAAREHSDDMNEYSKAKSEFVQSVVADAEAEAGIDLDASQ